MTLGSLMLFASCKAATVVLFAAAISLSVSPELIVTVLVEAGELEELDELLLDELLLDELDELLLDELLLDELLS